VAVFGGAGTALLAAGGAFAAEPSPAAGQPSDFQRATVSCGASAKQAAITVPDGDASGRVARIAVFPAGTPTTTVPARTTTGGSVTLDVPWVQGSGWDIHVALAGQFSDQTVKTVIIPRETCARAAASAARAAKAAKPGAEPAEAPAQAPSAGGVAPVAPAPGTLAESGGGEASAGLAILAGVLVAAGGGALYLVRRLARRG
jgi:hypothetical protein